MQRFFFSIWSRRLARSPVEGSSAGPLYHPSLLQHPRDYSIVQSTVFQLGHLKKKKSCCRRGVISFLGIGSIGEFHLFPLNDP